MHNQSGRVLVLLTGARACGGRRAGPKASIQITNSRERKHQAIYLPSSISEPSSCLLSPPIDFFL